MKYLLKLILPKQVEMVGEGTNHTHVCKKEAKVIMSFGGFNLYDKASFGRVDFGFRPQRPARAGTDGGRTFVAPNEVWGRIEDEKMAWRNICVFCKYCDKPI